MHCARCWWQREPSPRAATTLGCLFITSPVFAFVFPFPLPSIAPVEVSVFFGFFFGGFSLASLGRAPFFAVPALPFSCLSLDSGEGGGRVRIPSSDISESVLNVEEVDALRLVSVVGSGAKGTAGTHRNEVSRDAQPKREQAAHMSSEQGPRSPPLQPLRYSCWYSKMMVMMILPLRP